jgi:hypothetical protein
MPGVVKPVELPTDKGRLIESIRRKVGRQGGCWDLFLWRGDAVLFLEAKRRKKDRIQSSQAAWLEAALAEGLCASDFAVVEWDFTGAY